MDVPRIPRGVDIPWEVALMFRCDGSQTPYPQEVMATTIRTTLSEYDELKHTAYARYSRYYRW